MNSKTFLPVIFFIAFACSCPALLPAQQQSQAYKDMATEMLAYINIHRGRMGLKPLKMNGIITAAAQQHTLDMTTKKIPFGHDGFDERMGKLYKQMKPVYSFAENVAFGAANAKDVINQWLKSDEHRQNIEGKDYNLTGIGIAKGADSVLYFTEIFLYCKPGRE